VSKTKEHQIVEIHDKIRQMIIEKFVLRSESARKMTGKIILAIIKDLNAQSKTIKDHDVLICGPKKIEVTVNRFRHAVNLELKTCTCRAWQVTGKPCSHAPAFIAKLSREVQMDEFVHEYFSVERLRKAYAGTFIPMTSKDLWSRVNLGYKIHKPKLRRKSGRPRKSRFKAYDEVSSSKKRRLCSECHEPWHLAKTCQGSLTASQKRRLKSSQHGSQEDNSDPK
jgi:hypothetical protein